MFFSLLYSSLHAYSLKAGNQRAASRFLNESNAIRTPYTASCPAIRRSIAGTDQPAIRVAVFINAVGYIPGLPCPKPLISQTASSTIIYPAIPSLAKGMNCKFPRGTSTFNIHRSIVAFGPCFGIPIRRDPSTKIKSKSGICNIPG